MRNPLRVLHRWTGLTVGLILVFIAVTGAGIVFRPQLEPVVNADLLTVPACAGHANLDAATRRAQELRPRSRLDYVRVQAGVPGADRQPALAIRFTDQTFVYLDPCTGAVLGERHRYGGLLGTLEQLHRFRFMPSGSLVSGTAVLLAALLLVIGGVLSSLPLSWQGLARIMGLRGGRTAGLGLHQRLGFWAGAIILFCAMTGLPQAFEWFREAIYAISGPDARMVAPKPPSPPTLPTQPYETLYRAALALDPDPRELLMHYPAKPLAPVDLYMIGRDAPHANARSLVYLDPRTAKVLRYQPYADSSLGNRLYFWTLTLHTGQWGGLPFQALLLAGALSVPFMAYTGIASYLRRRRRAACWFKVRVAAIRDEGQGLRSFELRDPRGRKLPAFAAGAHIDVEIAPGLVRQYSLCNDPAERNRYLICVRHAVDSRGGSRAMHEELKQGQLLRVGRPRQRFPLLESGRYAILIAGGIGITPLIAMAETLQRSGREFELHYCAKSAQQAAFIERLKNSPFAARCVFYFSADAMGNPADFDAIMAAPVSGAHVYVCGPRRFMDAVFNAARRAGWPQANLHQEHFGAVAMAGHDNRSFTLELVRSGRRVTVPRDATALQALASAGVAVPSACGLGMCGSCLTTVLAGIPLHRDECLTPKEQARNDCFTPCCSRAFTETLVLDL